jgi:predicted PurR-regulated permease PerM
MITTTHVRWLEKRIGLPKAVGAAITLGIILVSLGYGAASLQSEALDVLDTVPRAMQKLTAAFRRAPAGAESAVDKVKNAANEIAKAADAATSPSRSPAVNPAPSKTSPTTTTTNFREYALTGTVSLIAGATQFVMVIFLVYFLLVTGDAFRRTLIRISGDTLTKKKITVQILDDIDSQIQRYLLVQLASSALLGAVIWALFGLMGMKSALVWRCIGAVLHLVPYVGPTAFVVVTALVAFAEFDTLQPVAIVTGGVLGSICVIGLLLVPWLTQKVGGIKAITVFVALLVWGWLWGVWGLLLGVPIVMAFNSVCERVEALQPLSQFLGTDSGN